MVPALRADFNARYADAKYRDLLSSLDERTRTHIEFRIAETPCFFTRELLDRMARAGDELTHQLVDSADYMQQSTAAIPEKWRMPNESRTPLFMTVDFGLVDDGHGGFQPKLVELQAFPSIYGYQSVLSPQCIETFGLDPALRYLLNDHTRESYWALLRRVIVANHAPENVILLDTVPETQKTLPDFNVTADNLGIRIVDIAKLVKQGSKLYYKESEALLPHGAQSASNTLVPIHRIYNRAIVDELERNHVALPFEYRDELDVEWAGHPNWYFRISKFSLPFLDHPTVPKAIFLDELDRNPSRLAELPHDRSQWILKPLYSFAGKGIQFAPTDADFAAIPAEHRHDYLVQERVQFASPIATPEGATQAEVRILYIWPDGEAMQPVTTLVRMGRGLMMGVDHNRDRTWVGGSAGLFLP
jgi:hypothetical protein